MDGSRNSGASSFFNNTKLVDHVVVLNFWASWCDSCASERIYLNQLFQEFGHRIMFAGIATQDTDVNIEKSGKAKMIPYMILRDDEGQVLDAVGAGALPHTVIFSSTGKFLGEVFGAINPKEQDRIRGILNRTLAVSAGG